MNMSGSEKGTKDVIDWVSQLNALNRCNTVQGIESYLTDLDGLHRLIEDRHQASKELGLGKLREFLILGHWATDSCGNFGDLTFLDDHYKPVTVGEALPRVLTYEDRAKYGLDHMQVSHGRTSIPPSRIKCAECEKTWTIDNAADSITEHDTQVQVLFAQWGDGKTTLRQAADQLAKDTSREYVLGYEKQLKNEKYIDLSPDPKWPESKVNEHGWIQVDPEKHIVQEGDAAMFYVWQYFHQRCYALRKSRLARATFEGLFEKAIERRMALLEEIPNQYCPCETCPPWFIAKLPYGDIKIGWRKRVINIDWSATGKRLGKLFEGEPVTQDDFYVHAYGYEKATEYLKKLHAALS